MVRYNESGLFDNVSQAWSHWYDKLSTDTDAQSSRDGDVVGEIIGCTSIINDPTKFIVTDERRKLSMRYAVGEMLWYLSGSQKLKDIQKFTHGWDRMSDDGVTVNSNYGYCITQKYGFNQFEYVKNELLTNPNSRRAVIHIKGPSNVESKDVNCTCVLQFFIRDGKLYETVYMRSNDIWMGFPYDCFQFMSLQVLMSMHLDVELGTYTHIVGSLHLYGRNLIKEL